MHTYLWRLIGATVVCSIWVYVMFNFVGPIGLVLSAPVIGIAFTRLVIDAAAEMGWRARSAVLAPLSGNHYVYMGFNLKVVEDEDFGRWMSLADVRRIVGSGATDKALSQSYPSGYQVFDGKPHLRDDALLLYLAREPSTPAIKLRNWVERNIAFPARTERKRRGIYLRDPALDPE
jgi:hypothetical protein